MPSPAGGARPLPMYLASEPNPKRVFGRERPPFLARVLFRGDKKRRAFVFVGLLIKLALVLAVVYRKNELRLARWVSSPPPSYCASLLARRGSDAPTPTPTPATPPPHHPLVCAHSGDHDHPSPDSPDALREARAAGTGCVLLHVAATADGALVAIRSTPAALGGLLTRPAASSPLARRAAALVAAGGARAWWRRATVGDLTLEELGTLRWRRPTRRRRRRRGRGDGESEGAVDDQFVLTLEQALDLLLLPPPATATAATTNATALAPPPPPTTLIVDLERLTGAARASVPPADFARRAVAAAERAGCGSRCLFWAMHDDLVLEAGEALGRLRQKTKGKKGRRRRAGGGEAGEEGQEAEGGAAYEPLPSSSSSSTPRLGYFVADRRDPRHPRFEGAASAAAVHVTMLSPAGGGGNGAGVARALHSARGGGGQRAPQALFAYLINRAAPLRAAVVAGADAIVTDRASDTERLLAAWRGACENKAAAGRRRQRRR